MLKRLLSTVVMLAFLLCGATIAMEAMGLIFQAGPADPERRIEAVVAQIEASLGPNVPSEADGLWPAPEAQAATDETPVVSQPAADLPDQEKPAAVAVSSAWTVVAERESVAEPETSNTPEPMAVVEAVATTVSAPIQRAKACGSACNATPPALKRARAPPTASAGFDRPLMGWIDMTLLP
jgi:hypothetical protein